MRRERRTKQAEQPGSATKVTPSLGFSPVARAAFVRLPEKARVGLRRKLHDFGANPAIGKPLIGTLQGYFRVSYGRLRAICTIHASTVLVLIIGLRREGASDDPYERAAIAALQSGDSEARELVEKAIQEDHARSSESAQIPED